MSFSQSTKRESAEQNPLTYAIDHKREKQPKAFINSQIFDSLAHKIEECHSGRLVAKKDTHSEHSLTSQRDRIPFS